MAYDLDLAERIELLSVNWPGFSVKRMFGGLGYLLHGNMAFGVLKDQLIVRCGPAKHASCLARAHVREFDLTGRPMHGWVMVAAEGLGDDQLLTSWLQSGRDFAASLPAKSTD
jgi:TfoX/Sxy family transcriptional regulator of competence genes